MASDAVGTSDDTRMQIGDVAERTGLSLRTIRYYEEIGLLPAASRSAGGFRLYAHEAVERLLVIKHMKPLDFSLDQMRELLEIRERLASPRLSAKTRSGLLNQQEQYLHLVEQKITELRDQVARAEAFAGELRG